MKIHFRFFFLIYLSYPEVRFYFKMPISWQQVIGNINDCRCPLGMPLPPFSYATTNTILQWGKRKQLCGATKQGKNPPFFFPFLITPSYLEVSFYCHVLCVFASKCGYFLRGKPLPINVCFFFFFFFFFFGVAAFFNTPPTHPPFCLPIPIVFIECPVSHSFGRANREGVCVWSESVSPGTKKCVNYVLFIFNFFLFNFFLWVLCVCVCILPAQRQKRYVSNPFKSVFSLFFFSFLLLFFPSLPLSFPHIPC